MTDIPENCAAILSLLPRSACGAEVGSHTGRWTRALRDICAPTSLTLIDPWAEDAEQDRRPRSYVAEQAQRDSDFATVARDFPEAHILRHPSGRVLPHLSAGVFDWIFLDGNKHYDVVLSDLEQAARLVRPGGVIAGGGWFWGKELGHPVREAVTDLVDRLPGARVTQMGQFWAIQLPDTVALAPRPIEERFLVISTMKNEAPFILEWLAHHRAIGFTDFLIYTNDCDDTTDPLLDRLQERGMLTHQVNTVLRRGPHKSALKWARDHVLRHKATWTLIADVDEFINVRTGDGTIQSLMQTLGPDTDVVSFPWKVFGNGGVEGFDDTPITQQFTTCEPVPRRGGRQMRDVKTMFRKPQAMYHLGLHRPRVREDWADRITWRSPTGEDISAEMNQGQRWTMRWNGCQDAAYMHHYPLRSMESYILKKNRGRANHVGEDLGLDYWDKWNMDGGRDGSLAKGAPGFAEALAELRSDRQTRQLHKQGVAWHRAQFETLLEEPRYRALWNTLKTRHGRGMTAA